MFFKLLFKISFYFFDFLLNESIYFLLSKLKLILFSFGFQTQILFPLLKWNIVNAIASHYFFKLFLGETNFLIVIITLSTRYSLSRGIELGSISSPFSRECYLGWSFLNILKVSILIIFFFMNAKAYLYK